jgi:septum formation protein
MSDPVLHLASSSPRRRELLSALGLVFSYEGVAIDESALPGEAAQIFGKPGSKEEALEMLAGLSGRLHEVLSGVAVVAHGELETAISRTEVQFREIHPDEAEAYWQSGEPAGKAGAYAVQGLGGIFVSAIKGSYTGVVGLRHKASRYAG